MENLVRKITVDIATSYAKGAGTEAQVFLGLGGREFRLDIDAYEDFDRGDEVTYELGEGGNVVEPERNDPRIGYPVTLDGIKMHPVYLRMVPKKDSDDWNLANVRIRCVAGSEELRYSALDGGSEHIWLGLQSGTVLYLKPSAG